MDTRSQCLRSQSSALTDTPSGLHISIEPDWLPNIYGCHTITMADDLMALDCKALKWRA